MGMAATLKALITASLRVFHRFWRKPTKQKSSDDEKNEEDCRCHTTRQGRITGGRVHLWHSRTAVENLDDWRLDDWRLNDRRLKSRKSHLTLLLLMKLEQKAVHCLVESPNTVQKGGGSSHRRRQGRRWCSPGRLQKNVVRKGEDTGDSRSDDSRRRDGSRKTSWKNTT
jgi:hypothetical protein